MTYIVAMENNAFYGVNLHYTKPSNRSGVLDYILADQDYTKLPGFNKYLRSYVKGMFLQLKGNDVDIPIKNKSPSLKEKDGQVQTRLGNVKVKRVGKNGL